MVLYYKSSSVVYWQLERYLVASLLRSTYPLTIALGFPEYSLARGNNYRELIQQLTFSLGSSSMCEEHLPLLICSAISASEIDG